MLRYFTTAFAAAFVLAATGLAGAADVANKAPARDAYAASGPTFGGFYIGPSLGYGWATTDITSPNGLQFKPDGWALGAQAGVNFQHGQVVVGLEVDAMWMNIKGKLEGTGCTPTTCGLISSKYDLIGTARGRMGLTILNPSTLFYVTGGLAFGKSAVVLPGAELSTNRFGWVGGAGVEMLISPHWTVRAEYLRIDFGNGNFLASTGPATDDVVNIGKVGLNFKF